MLVMMPPVGPVTEGGPSRVRVGGQLASSPSRATTRVAAVAYTSQYGHSRDTQRANASLFALLYLLLRLLDHLAAANDGFRFRL